MKRGPSCRTPNLPLASRRPLFLPFLLLLLPPSPSPSALQPIAVAAVCAWLAYGSWNAASRRTTEAIILGSLLALSFALTAASLLTGLVLGRAWQQLPGGVSWEVVQLMEMVPTLLHAAILTHWSLLIGRTLTTAVLALLYELGFATSVLSLLDPTHALALQFIIIAHQVGAHILPFAPSPSELGARLNWVAEREDRDSTGCYPPFAPFSSRLP